MTSSERFQQLGWVDESDPNGVGYKIMTEVGVKVFDKEERDEYLKEKARIEDSISKLRRKVSSR